MNFLIFGTSLGFVSEVSLGLTIGFVAVTLIATTIHVIKASRKKRIWENKQRLKAEAAERQAKLDEEYFQKKAKRLEERAKAEKVIVQKKEPDKKYFSWEDIFEEENEQEWLEYIG